MTLTKGFWLGQRQVTQAEWQLVMQTTPWSGASTTFVKEGDDYPVVSVSWHDAMKFCETLTESERRAGRLPAHWQCTLPTEAQWEYACRAGTKSRFSFGDDESDLSDFGWWGDPARGTRMAGRHARSVKKRRIRGAFLTCTGTCGNGAGIGTRGHCHAERTRRVLQRAWDGRTGAGAGALTPGSAGRRPAVGTRRIGGTPTWASAWP